MPITLDDAVEELRQSAKFLAWRSPQAPSRLPFGRSKDFTYIGESYTNHIIDEQHFTPAELAKTWCVSVQTIRELFKSEPGVLTIGSEGTRNRRAYKTLRFWVDWVTPSGARIGKSLGLRDWQAAQRRARDMEADGLAAASAPRTIAHAAAEFVKDAESRHLKEPTIRKYRWLFRTLEDYCQGRGLVFIGQLNEEEVRSFRNTWSLSPRTAGKHLERMKAFFRFCQDMKYIKESPAARLKAPKVGDAPVIPFTEDQVGKILAACDKYRGDGTRLRALTELMLATGLRIGDACTIPREKIVHDKEGYSVELYTAKTGEKVTAPSKTKSGVR